MRSAQCALAAAISQTRWRPDAAWLWRRPALPAGGQSLTTPRRLIRPNVGGAARAGAVAMPGVQCWSRVLWRSRTGPSGARQCGAAQLCEAVRAEGLSCLAALRCAPQSGSSSPLHFQARSIGRRRTGHTRLGWNRSRAAQRLWRLGWCLGGRPGWRWTSRHLQRPACIRRASNATRCYVAALAAAALPQAIAHVKRWGNGNGNGNASAASAFHQSARGP